MDTPEQKRQEKPLSQTQQIALFAPVSHLEVLSLGLGNAGILGITSPRSKGGFIQTQPFSSEVAKWALPYARRIRAGGDLFRAGKFQQALDIFLSIYQELPEAAIILMNIGVCYAELGDRETALFWLKKSQHVIPPDYEYQVSQNLSNLGDTST